MCWSFIHDDGEGKPKSCSLSDVRPTSEHQVQLPVRNVEHQEAYKTGKLDFNCCVNLISTDLNLCGLVRSVGPILENI